MLLARHVSLLISLLLVLHLELLLLLIILAHEAHLDAVVSIVAGEVLFNLDVLAIS